jgi:cation:H+ antiporter
MLNLTAAPLTLNLVIFAVAAAAVWAAGTRIARYADAIGAKTGIGHAALGLLLLGGVTSLPEGAVTVSASISGNTALAVNNLLGGVAMQVAILAAADVAMGRQALTTVIPDPSTMLQGALNIVLLTFVGAGIIVGGGSVLGAGVWSWVVLAFYLYSIRLLAVTREHKAWHVGPTGEQANPEVSSAAAKRDDDGSLSSVIWRTCAAASVILVAGFLLSQTGEAIAEQTGIGSSFVGAVLVAISTSLPEISTVLSAARLGLYTMAISDIFGTNLFDIALIWLVDVASPGAPVLSTVGTFSSFAVLLAILVTVLYVAGLAERRDRTILRMGIDSLAVIVCYLGGVAILYSLR